MEIAGAPRAQRYRIVIRGRLSDRLGSAFPEMALERRAGQTVLRGCADEPGLRKLLDRLRDFGIEPLSCDVDG
jgi:hypothetical protein